MSPRTRTISLVFIPLLLALVPLVYGSGGVSKAEREGHAPVAPPPATTHTVAVASAQEGVAAAQESVASLRKRGPEALRAALALYDALPEGDERLAQAERIDAIAAQRYATYSRLYWYTDLELAKAAAAASAKPILSLRMLGRLDEDYSCANSRLFRAILYADPKVSAVLREHYILHWSSERMVPKITVDFGDGRVMRSTIAGNSAHYILSPEGKPLDVIPGLYSPDAFIEELQAGLDLAKQYARGKDRAALLRRYHQEALRQQDERFSKLPAAQRAILGRFRRSPATGTLMGAEVLTISKMATEAPMARALEGRGAATEVNPATAMALLATFGAGATLSESTRQLIEHLGPTDWSSPARPLQGDALEMMVQQIARRVEGDTLLNAYALRGAVHDIFVSAPDLDFAQLNQRVYSEIFGTPGSDPWLGMAQTRSFSALPGDGLRSAKVERKQP